MNIFMISITVRHLGELEMGRTNVDAAITMIDAGLFCGTTAQQAVFEALPVLYRSSNPVPRDNAGRFERVAYTNMDPQQITAHVNWCLGKAFEGVNLKQFAEIEVRVSILQPALFELFEL